MNLLITGLAQKRIRIKLIHLQIFGLRPLTISLRVHCLAINFGVISFASIFQNTFAIEIVLLIKNGFDFLGAHRDRILIKWRHGKVFSIVCLRMPSLTGVFLVSMLINIPALIWRWQHWIIYLRLRWKLVWPLR